MIGILGTKKRNLIVLLQWENFLTNSLRTTGSPYSLGKNVTLDEKLEAFRGQCAFRQYIPSKPAKYGIQTLALVDTRLFHTSNIEIYAGMQPEGPFSISNKSRDVVCRTVTPLVNSGRNLTAGNWFSDVSLLEDSTKEKNSFFGTLKRNKWQIPY
ncbi:hypothetical protein AVEN_243707-1 [Araneus ventricosus]|uniref:PiggyBac transposable element-derived protein domain-containing protein n=1 Tax=Araneus ventricosus TaxID=182803 RepID=A0A4Y2A4W9_ARAVE|nr:hypothetical protein AVEN_243707-1 [Araneus ventricosus]